MLGKLGCTWAVLLLLACTDDEKEPSRDRIVFPLPSDCDGPLPEAALGPGGFLWLSDGVRMIGPTAFYVNDRDLYAQDVPDGSPRLLASLPDSPASAEGEKPYFRQALVGDRTVFASDDQGAIYRVSPDGGDPTLIVGPPPSLEDEVRELRVTLAGDSFYLLLGGYDDRAFIYRAPSTGGEWGLAYEFDEDPSLWTFAPGTSALYRHSRHTNETWALPYDGGEAELALDAPFHELLGAYERPILMAEDLQTRTLVLSHGWEEGQRPSGPAVPPGHRVSTGRHGRPSIVRYDDALYFVATADFTLPDDRREETRAVLMRLSPELDWVEPVRCIPPAAFDANITDGGQPYQIDDIAASDDGVFVLRRIEDPQPASEEASPYVVRVWP